MPRSSRHPAAASAEPAARRAAALLAAIALTAAGCGGGGDDRQSGVVVGRTLTIYSSLPQRGDAARSSADLVRAESLALAEAGGRAGRFRVRFVSLDNTDAATGALGSREDS